ncbi:DUF2911 domain-containing protein [Sungkyunkwania multivorans]|uniref:DUF2911 domain-containing protein n=1 Tax=Sungkyunkwania multivorans TaxID=1173618 RepID=A0ABW3CSB7_9FLAO
MRTRQTLFTIAFAFVMLFTNEITAQKFSGLDKSPADIVYFRTSRNAAPAVKVIYSRPQLKGRKVGSDLATYGKVWRTGANEATEVTFYQDVKFGGETVKAGTYSLFTVPGEKSWKVILNSDLHQWGAYQHDPSNDVVTVTVPAGTDNDSIEAFAIAFKKVSDGAHMVLGWDKTRVAIPISM